MAVSGELPAALSSSPSGAVRNPLSGVRVETAIARSAAVAGIVFFLQSVAALADQAPNLHGAWVLTMVPALIGSLLLAVVASFLGWAVRATSLVFPAVYLIALVTWPFAVLDPELAPTSSFWLYFLLTVATVMATVGLSLLGAIAYLIVAPLIYGAIRLTQAGGGIPLDLAALDSLYAILLGGFVTIVASVLRDTARAVDRAQATALERYAHAVRQHATEAERVQVDAIVHDSVLTTLLTAARAYTAEAKALAATMAGNAIGFLRDAVASGPDADAMVSGAALSNRIEAAASTMSQPIEVRTAGIRDRVVPVHAAEALYSAAVQAMVNSLQHAGPEVERWVTIQGSGADQFTIEVGDAGAGFELDAVPTERLGVRVSILERVSSAGGRATIETAPGAGTRVRMSWPDAEASPAPVYEDFSTASIDVVEAER